MLRVQWEILSSEIPGLGMEKMEMFQDVHYKVDPKKPDLFGTKQWLCDKTPVCKNGRKYRALIRL